MLSKVKYVAKNVIYLKGWSKKNLDKKINHINYEDKVNFGLKII